MKRSKLSRQVALKKQSLKMRAHQMLQYIALILVMLRGVAFKVPIISRRIGLRAASTTTGTPGSPDYRIFFTEKGHTISPWHDIPLRSGDLFNYVNEIPKFTKAKFEINTKEASSPIAQDKKNGKLRDYCGPIYWNYGAFPQTWEDPNVNHPVVHCKGDNDPLDVVEIGSKALAPGTVHQVKVLGILGMIDDGELDWKVISIRAEDELAAELNDIGDVEKKCPGVVSGIREWFRWYKTPDGKPLNRFGFDEKALPKKVALEVIEETHHYWKDLCAGKTDKGKLWVKK